MDGLAIDCISGQCPVQAWGVIDGREFYFRSRHAHWSLTVYKPATTRSDIAAMEWSRREPWGEQEHDASWMPHDEARRMIERAATKYRAFRARNVAGQKV